MIAAIIFLVGLAVLLTGAWILIPPPQRQQIINLIAGWTVAGINGAVTALTTVEDDLAGIALQFVQAFNSSGNNVFSQMKEPFTTLTTGVLNEAFLALVQGGESTPDNAVATATAAMGEAFGFGLASAATSAFFEACLPEKLNVLNGAGPMLAKMAGFDEIAAAVRDPLYENAFGKSLDYHFRSIFKPELPSDFQAVLWHARRYITDDQLRTLFGYSGLKQEWEEPFINAAYTTIQPRALSTLYQDVPFDTPQMTLLLERAGLSPEQIPILLKAFQWNAVKNVRTEYVTAAVRSTELGTMTPAELGQELTTLGYSSEAIDLIQLTVATRKLEQLAGLYRKSISEAYKTGQITDAQYVPSLEAIGIGAADAQAHYAVDSIAKTGKALAQALRAEERLASQRIRAGVAAAVASYRSGFFDAAALEAALLATGLDPVVAALSVQVQTQRRDGGVVLVYGVELPRAAALELRDKVAALAIQVRARLVSPDDALTALAGYGVPRANALALVAEWAATTVTPARVGILEPR